MSMIINPKLAATYRMKAAQGKKYPLRNLESSLKRSVQYDDSGKVAFKDNGMPFTSPFESICFLLGWPLPQDQITQRLDAFNQRLSTVFSNKRYGPNQSDTFHLSFFGTYLWAVGETTLPPHPMMQNLQCFKAFAGRVADVLQFGPFTFHFKDLALFDDGAVVACGYPQDNTVDSARENYLASFPEVAGCQDICHITLGRFFAQPSKREHSLMLSEIAAFNRIPIGNITFNQLLLGYEKVLWYPSIVAAIDLESRAVSIDESAFAR
ncbi:MAG: hypothetical protein HQ564_07830 [Candidatus Saganbacteria bacterium]|nr:hypothetical protein [Candidatus Saganbacteria bacterium]